MGKHRSRLEIVENILSVINYEKSVKRTQIMYKTYLNYDVLSRYLNDILAAGLIKCCKTNQYSLTVKGEKFLTMFSDYTEFRKIVDKQLNQIDQQLSTLKEMLP